MMDWQTYRAKSNPAAKIEVKERPEGGFEARDPYTQAGFGVLPLDVLQEIFEEENNNV